MDNLFEQMAQISKAHGYDILAEEVRRLQEENRQLRSERDELAIRLKGEITRVEALREFINDVKPKDATLLQMAKTENDPDDLKGVL